MEAPMEHKPDAHHEHGHHQLTYHITVDNKPFEWHQPFITGAEIKALVHAKPDYGVWLVVKGPISPVIGPSSTKGAGTRSWPSAAMKVMGFQLPCGTSWTTRSPCRARP